MSGYRALHRKAVPKPSPLAAGTVELLQHASTPAEDSFPKVDYVEGHTTVDEDDAQLEQPSAFRIFLRTMQLDTLWNGCRRLAGRGPQIEGPKQAMIKSLPIAMLTLFATHFLPLAAALVDIVMNMRGYYVGGNFTGNFYPSDDVKLSLLQFAAKAHEVMMQASLSVIIVGLVRHELVMGEGIPFGAIFGSLQFTNISYLFSKEFMGMVTARLGRPLVKARIIALLFVGAVLAVTVGPSSAIAMRPRLDDWPAGGTDFYLNSTPAEIWPLTIDASAITASCHNITFDTACISRDWETISSQLISYYPSLTVGAATMPELVRLNSPKSVREMYSAQSQGLYQQLASFTTAPMSQLADAVADNGRLWAIAAAIGNWKRVSTRIRRFQWRKDATYSLEGVFQPGTRSQCVPLKKDDTSLTQMLFPTTESMCDGTYYFYSWQQLEEEQSKIVDGFYSGTATTPQLQFIELPFETFGNNTMGAIATLPSSWPGGSKLFGCIIEARWAPATIQSKRQAMKSVSSSVADWPVVYFCNTTSPSIQVTKEWMDYLNPSIQATDKTVFHTLIEAAGAPPLIFSSTGEGDVYYQSVVETILSTMTTSGLSRTRSDATVQGTLKGCNVTGSECVCGSWCLDMMPASNQEFGYGRNIYNMSQIPDIFNLTKFTIHVDVNGYAYNLRGASMVLSCTVLIAYCLLVFVHIVFVAIDRSSSTSFDSVSEIVSLAMQSQPTGRLHHTAAGIYSTKVFTNLVKIIRTGEKRDHLELDFGDHPDGGDKIREGEFYS